MVGGVGGGPTLSLAPGGTQVVVDGTRTVVLPTVRGSGSVVGTGGVGGSGSGTGAGPVQPTSTSTGGIINQGLGMGEAGRVAVSRRGVGVVALVVALVL